MITRIAPAEGAPERRGASFYHRPFGRTRFGGEGDGDGTTAVEMEQTAFERRYRIGELAEMWKLGRETVRLLVKNEQGVIKIRLGRKRADTSYSVPESVARPHPYAPVEQPIGESEAHQACKRCQVFSTVRYEFHAALAYR